MRARRQRFSIGQPVRFYRVDELVRARAEDVSASGLFVRTQAWLPVNGVVELQVLLPDGSELTLPSRVVHCLPPERASEVGRASGIGFALLPDDNIDAIAWKLYLSTLSREQEGQVPEACIRALVVSNNPRLHGRVINALQGIVREVSFYDGAQPPSPSLSGSGWDIVLLDDAVVTEPHVVRLMGAMPADVPTLWLLGHGGSSGRASLPPEGSHQVLAAPFSDWDLLQHVFALIDTSAAVDMAGELAKIQAGSILSLLEYERREGVLSLHGPMGSVHLSVADGQILGARGPSGYTGAELVRLALSLRQGRFEFRQVNVQGLPRSGRPISHALLEHAQEEDEGRF